MAPASTKYSERSPRMAHTFEVNTMNGLVVTAKMAGMESVAKTTSDNSTMMSVRKSGVAAQAPGAQARLAQLLEPAPKASASPALLSAIQAARREGLPARESERVESTRRVEPAPRAQAAVPDERDQDEQDSGHAEDVCPEDERGDGERPGDPGV